MPAYRFDGPIPYQYPSIRDTAGIHLNEVEPGEVRDLDAAPDMWWHPAGGEPPVPVADEDTPAEDPAPDGPQPAPPAIVNV